MSDLLTEEDKTLLRREAPRHIEVRCDLCDKPLGCVQVLEYSPDGYDYLVCMDCVKELGGCGK